MGILKFASEERKRFDLGDGDYVELKASLSKRSFNALIGSMPNREISDANGLTLVEGLEFQQSLFGALVTGWSLDAEPTIENYLALDRESSDAVDKVLVEHFNAMSPTKEEVSKASTSRAKAPRG